MNRDAEPNRWIFFGFGIFIGFLGFVVGSQIGAVQLQGGLTFGNIMQAGTTLVVAFVVSHYLQRQTAADRKERELVLRHCDHAVNSLDKLESFGHSIALVELNASLKKIGADIRAAGDLMKELDYKDGAQKHTGTDELLREIRRLATETPRATTQSPSSVQPQVSVSNGMVTWSAERVAILDTKIHQLRMRLLRCQVAINRA